MFCKRCGANLRDTAQFCPKCGSPTGNHNGNRKNPVPPPTPPKQKKSHIWVIFLILALLLVLVAGAGGWYVWNNSGSHGTNSKKTDEKSEDNSAQFSQVESVNTPEAAGGRNAVQSGRTGSAGKRQRFLR